MESRGEGRWRSDRVALRAGKSGPDACPPTGMPAAATGLQVFTFSCSALKHATDTMSRCSFELAGTSSCERVVVGEREGTGVCAELTRARVGRRNLASTLCPTIHSGSFLRTPTLPYLPSPNV